MSAPPHSVLPPPRWGRVGVGVMRAGCIDWVENRSNRPPRTRAKRKRLGRPARSWTSPTQARIAALLDGFNLIAWPH